MFLVWTLPYYRCNIGDFARCLQSSVSGLHGIAWVIVVSLWRRRPGQMALSIRTIVTEICSKSSNLYSQKALSHRSACEFGVGYLRDTNHYSYADDTSFLWPFAIISIFYLDLMWYFRWVSRKQDKLCRSPWPMRSSTWIRLACT